MIIITGASKGIGRFLFSKFKEQNQAVVGTYNNTFVGLEADMDSYFKVNVADYNEVKKMISSIHQSELKNLILINCAGISYSSFAHKADVQKWYEVIDVNVKGSFNFIHQLLPIMRNQNYGRVINFSSVIAKFPTAGVSAYAASKAALIGLTKSLSAENASKGITVNAINLGYTNIGMGVNDVPQPVQEKLKTQIPAGRFCNPEEVYLTVKFLIENEYVNGADINLNGGLV